MAEHELPRMRRAMRREQRSSTNSEIWCSSELVLKSGGRFLHRAMKLDLLNCAGLRYDVLSAAAPNLAASHPLAEYQDHSFRNSSLQLTGWAACSLYENYVDIIELRMIDCCSLKSTRDG